MILKVSILQFFHMVSMVKIVASENAD